jgi:hypothetical protein
VAVTESSLASTRSLRLLDPALTTSTLGDIPCTVAVRTSAAPGLCPPRCVKMV